MADLKALFAKKDSNGQSGSASVSPAPDANKPEVVSPSASSVGAVQDAPPTPEAAPSQPANTGKKGFAFGVKRPSGPAATESVPSGGTDSSSEQPKPGLSAISIPAGTRDSGGDTGGVAAPSLDSLDALNSSEDAGVAPASGQSVAYFADETPAQKPTRELPEDITKEQLGFVDLIDGIYEIIHDPDLLGGVIRNIMVELKSNPEYQRLMAPEDFRTMVRGMRESMGLARVKKQETKTKKTGAKKSKALDDDVLMGLDDVLGDLGG